MPASDATACVGESKFVRVLYTQTGDQFSKTVVVTKTRYLLPRWNLLPDQFANRNPHLAQSPAQMCHGSRDDDPVTTMGA
jgi:hypothetical protein